MTHDTPAAGDLIRRFIFESRPVRGYWVRLDSAWRALREHTDYPAPVTELLGEAVVAAVLLAATIKFRGTLTFQLQGNGAVGLLVAQCTHDFRLRAVARCDAAALGRLAEAAPRSTRFRHMVGTESRITVTIESDESSMRYQGVVPLSGTSLDESLEAYFSTSEQLPTRVRLTATDGEAGGLLVQKLPEDRGTPEDAAEAWEGAEQGIGRLSAARVLSGGVEALLAESFPGWDLRLYRGAPVRFECRCSQGRVAGLLRALGADEVREVLQEQGAVTVTCEFCHRPYRFDSVDVDALFKDVPLDGSQSIH